MEDMGADDKSKVLMVGDRCFDIDGAHEAGIKCCGALWGFGSEDEFKEHNAEFIVKNPLEIIK
jgi:phosphoglycolate phosphatase